MVLPVAVDPGHEDDPKAYEFENAHAYFEDYGGEVIFVPGNANVRVFTDAMNELRKLARG